MDVLAITSAGYGGRLCFLDESSICYASGHGVVIQDKETGQQKHIWTLPDGQGYPPPNINPATFATCPGGHLLAYVQQGGLQQQIQVVQQETLLPASTIKDPGARHIEFAQLVFDTEGTRLASVGGAPDYQLDVWDVDQKESLVRVLLPDSLTGLEPTFFPLNSHVLAVAGPDAARIIWDEPLAGARVVRQSEVDLSVLWEGEQLNCTCWTPNGMLLLGTTAGRVLGVRCAAPPAIPAPGWGVAAGGGHVAELMYGSTVVTAPPPPAAAPALRSSVSLGRGGGGLASAGLLYSGAAPPKTGVAAVVVTSMHVLLVVAGDARNQAELVWLTTDTLQPIATASLPLRSLVRAVTSPSYEQLAIAAADGAIVLCRTNCPVSAAAAAEAAAESSGIDGDAGAAGEAGVRRTASRVGVLEQGPGAVVKATAVKLTEVVRYHRGRLNSCLWLSARRFLTGGEDGTVRMWNYVPSDTDPPDNAIWATPALNLEATWHVSQPITCMAALNPPLPAGAEWPTSPTSRSGTGTGDSTNTGGGGGAGNGVPEWAAAASRPPAFVLCTADGVVQVCNTDRVPADMADITDAAIVAKSLAPTWSVKVFDGAITTAAFSQDGRFCAVSSVEEGKVAFLRVMVLGHELSMRILGFYPIREPRLLAWGPPEPGSIQPLLVVGSILGELQVLTIPESGAMEDDRSDGIMTRGSLLKACMRAQSHVTSMLVYPVGTHDTRAGGGHFWVITTHADKGVRRYRMFTDQQKSAAAMAARAAAGAQGSQGADGVAGAAATAAAARGGSSSPAAPLAGSDSSFNRSRPATGQNLGRTISIAPGNQNFQMPEAEKPLELQTVANALSISLLPGGGPGAGGGGGGGSYGSPLRMAIAASDGSVALYSMPEIALQGRWLLHELTAGGATSVSLLGDKVLSVGGEGSIQVLELSSLTRGARHVNHRVSHVDGAAGGGLLPSSPSPVSRSPAPGAGGVGGLAQRSAFFSATGPPRPRGMEKATLGSVLPPGLQPMLPEVYTDADVALSWQEAKAQATQELYREQLTSFRRKAQTKCGELMSRLEELKKVNEAADEVERLSPEEFVIDTGLRRDMLAQAESRYEAAKAQLQRQMRMMEFKRQRLKEQCLGAMECVARPLVALPEYSFISPMDPAEARKYRFEGEAAAARTAAEGGVWSYGLRKMSAMAELRLRQVSFLRKVEQADCASRSSQERGAVVGIRRYRGDMLRRFHLTTEEDTAQQPGGSGGQPGAQQQQQQQQQPGSGQQGQPGGGLQGSASLRNVQGTAQGTAYDDDDLDDDSQSQGDLSRKGTRRYRDDGFEGTELGYGETGLLYADVQLYTHCRRATQLVLIQEEARCLRRLFNTRWEESQRAKAKALDRIDERLGRIVEVQKELTKLAVDEGVGEAPPPAPLHVPGEYYVWRPEEEMAALAEVKEADIKVPKYISPEELARRAAAAKAEEEARRRAAADDSRNRALKEMMNNNPAISRQIKGGKNRAVREPWMDLPPAQLSKEQRLKLAEWEKKQQETAEELEKQRRLLEAERRALEVEIVEMAAAVNADLTRLAGAKVRMGMEVVHLERRAIDLADMAASLAAAEAARTALSSHLGAFTTRRTRRAPLLTALEQRVVSAQRFFDDISFSEKQVDRAFRREFSSRPELWDDAQKVYRARAHLLQGQSSQGSVGDGSGGGTARVPRKSALELLGKSPEGLALASVLEAPGLVEPSVSHSMSSIGSPSRASTNARLARGIGGFEPLGGNAAGAAGGSGPDVHLGTPRGVPRPMSHIARPQPRPGSALLVFAQRHLDHGPFTYYQPPQHPINHGSHANQQDQPEQPPQRSEGEASANATATTASGEAPAATAGGTAPLAPPKPRHGIAAVLHMAGDEASLARRGVSQRPAGLRLRALVEKAGRPLDSLLQLVADGTPASALAAELGLLGLQGARAHIPGFLNPFKVDGVARVFSPEATGAAEALADAIGGAGSVGGSTAGGGAGSVSPTRERSAMSVVKVTANGSVSPTKAEDMPREDDEEEDPLDSKERPEGMDDAMWIRLLEFRQTRADLEAEAEDAWRRVSLLTAQLDWAEAEDAEMEAQVEEAGARAAALRDGAVRLALDVYLSYRLKNGQVELPDRPGDVVGAGDVAADAILLHRNRVEALNDEVLSRGDGKIEILETLRHTRRRIHLTQWETEAAEIQGQHAAQRLTELQLLHVTKDLQAALRDPTIVDRMNEEARLAVVWQSATNLHSHRLDLRKRQLDALAQRVSRSGAEQGELTVAEAAAEAAYGESTRMHGMMAAARAAEEASHRRHMRNIVTNTQLREISAQQATELEKLNKELHTAHERNFPALAPILAWMPPDYRPPSPGGASLGGASSVAGGGGAGTRPGSSARHAVALYGSAPGTHNVSRASTAPGGASRGGMGSAAASRPVSALPLPGPQRRPPSVPRSSGGGGGSRVSTPLGWRAGSAANGGPPPVTRSGGAGATLTRAYATAQPRPSSSAFGAGPPAGGLPAAGSGLVGGASATSADRAAGTASRGSSRPPSGARPMSRRA